MTVHLQFYRKHTGIGNKWSLNCNFAIFRRLCNYKGIIQHPVFYSHYPIHTPWLYHLSVFLKPVSAVQKACQPFYGSFIHSLLQLLNISYKKHSHQNYIWYSNTSLIKAIWLLCSHSSFLLSFHCLSFVFLPLSFENLFRSPLSSLWFCRSALSSLSCLGRIPVYICVCGNTKMHVNF